MDDASFTESIGSVLFMKPVDLTNRFIILKDWWVCHQSERSKWAIW